jgi:uncharacterized protein YndB with AHSA1/START domain
MASGVDRVFRALADPTRRHLLDRLREDNGLTLGELCARVGMTRQSVTQHLGVLEEANLVSTLRRGREKLHYLNPVPLTDIQERWISAFDRPRLAALADLRRRAEETMSDKPTARYVIYVRSTPEAVWEALTDEALTARFWGHRNVSDWRPGSPWQHVRTDGSDVADVVGTVVEADPPRRLVTTWRAGPGMLTGGESPEAAAESRVAIDVEPYEGIVRVTVLHEDLADEAERDEALGGWAAVLSNLKSLLETGDSLPRDPWEMPGA